MATLHSSFYHSPLIRRRAPIGSAGFGLIEVMIAIFLTVVGVMAIMSMQPNAWRTVAKADYVGRAADILSSELERQQANIMNPCNSVVVGTTTDSVRASGQTSSLTGDAVYSVTTAIANVGANVFKVTITVSWNNGSNRVTESIVVARQDFFRFPAGCPNV